MRSTGTRTTILAALLLLAGFAHAATPAAAPAAPPISATQAQQVLTVLNNPKQRAAFIATLDAIAKSVPAPVTAAKPSPKVVLAPNSVGSELLSEVGVARRLALTQVDTFGGMFANSVLAARWLDGELRHPDSRAVLVDAAWRSTAVFLAALLAEQVVIRLLRRPLRALARDADTTTPPESDVAETPEARSLTLLHRVPFAVLRLLVKLLPLALFLAIGNFVAGTFIAHPVSQMVTVTAINLYGLGRLLTLGVDMLLAPRAPRVRLIRMSDSGAVLLNRWWAWLVVVPVVAITVIEIGGILQLPGAAERSLTRAIALVEHILVALLIWRLRHRVATVLSPPRRWRQTAFGLVLTRMAQYWWIAALFFDFALWVIYAAHVRDGYAKIWRLFLVSVAIIFGCRLVAAALLALLTRMLRAGDTVEQRYPGLELRAARYVPLLRRLIAAAFVGIGLVLLLQAWGLSAVSWFTQGALGTRVVSALIAILLALGLGVIAWEAANAALDRQIVRFGHAEQAARALRLQTLLPILRTVLFVTLAIVVGLSVLSQIGVDIAPLLAGAGILGVAIGFGSQKLVQDFITGIFLLVEDAMQVGDTVTAAGVTGTVEHLSIRTLRLRAGDGSVQIIPFSSVTTMINLSRDFAVAAITVSIAVGENTDRVCALLTEIGQGLREDEAFADFIIADFGLNGVDSIGEYAVAISGTIRCTTSGRWPVQREFYRRLNLALQAHHIAMPARTLALPGFDHETESAHV
ncbi:mechanosensitive ion channel family protein [Lichenicoccus sp.]|uniref:mechanosensitive ion channel family protein n=1 Tax=Lichenicoccus sp. TaxID=2781899 RepID=UPI003D141D63